MIKKICDRRDWFYALLTCMACFISLNTDLGSISVDATGGIWEFLAVNLKKLEYSIPTFSYRDGILAFLIFVFFLNMKRHELSEISCLVWRIPAVLTAFFLLFGYSFRYTNSWDLIFMDSFHMMLSMIIWLGYYVFFHRIYECLIAWLLLANRNEEKEAGIFTHWLFDRNAFAGTFSMILLFWLPYIIAKYPGAAMPETLAEMRQYYWNDFNNYYPPLHTILLSLIMELGNLIYSYTFGFFLNLMIQLVMLLSSFSYGFVLMKRWNTPYIFRYMALGIICVVQFFPMEATIVEKDIPYTACVIFLVLQCFEWIRTLQDNKMISVRNMLGMILTCMGAACFRNEGIYLVLSAGIGMSICAWYVLWKVDRKKCIRVFVGLLLPVVLFLGYQKLMLPALGVKDNGPQEALSIPFQQTARYVRDYSHELTPEDEEIISRVLDYENLAELYDPITSDPVKFRYHGETAEDLKDYFGLWFRQLIKHPGNAVEATMNNAYGWFYQEGYAHNYMMDSQIDGHEIRWSIEQPEMLDGFRQVMERVAKLLSRVPVINWFENSGFVSWMTILFAATLLGAGKSRYLSAILPLLTALLVCIAAPTFNYQVRYIMPVMFTVPFYIPMFLQTIQNQGNI